MGNGTPARFWCVNTTVYRQSAQDLERHARFLAKIGVNMVLVQITTTMRPTGWKTEDATFKEGNQTYHGNRTVATGKTP